MSQEIVRDVLSLTHGGNGLLQISRVPEDDRGDEEVEARDPMLLDFIGAVTNFTQPVDEDGARQTVAGFALIEFPAGRAAQVRVGEPIICYLESVWARCSVFWGATWQSPRR